MRMQEVSRWIPEQPYVLIFSSYRNCGSCAVRKSYEGEIIEHQKGITPVIDVATCGSSCES